MSFLIEFRELDKNLADTKTTIHDPEERAQLYLRHAVGVLSAIGDELHEANRLKRLELEYLKKRKV